MMRKTQIIIGRALYQGLLPLRRLYKSDKTRTYAVIEHNERVLIVKNWIGSGVWSLPGGGGQAGETEEDTLVREVHEETGIKVDKKQLKVILKGVHNREFGKKRFAIFHVKQTTRPNIVINSLEIVEHRWIEKRELSNLHPASYELKRVAEEYK